ncbi:MAG: prolipoprotein diacylglyceryl transferase [Firmicutes bacterium]|nr:prolipoprotein diacylglyceryl transferase [Bacillota bacterium]
MSPEVVFPHLGITIQHLSRAAFSIGGLEIYWYGITLVLGVIAGTAAACVRAKRSGQSPELYLDFLFFALIGSIVCARLYYVVFAWDEYKNNLLKVFALREGGLAIYGGVIGAFATGVIYTKVKKLNFWLFADTAIPGLIIGQAIGRWGNFFNREAFGGYTDSVFAMRYLANQAGTVPKSVLDRVITAGGAEYIQVHPTFLYESVWNLAVFLLLIFFTRKRKVYGEVTLLYLIAYGFGRFFIEGMRTDQLIIGHTGVPASQVFSVILVVGGVLVFLWRRKRAGAVRDAGTGAGVELINWGADRDKSRDAEADENADRDEGKSEEQDAGRDEGEGEEQGTGRDEGKSEEQDAGRNEDNDEKLDMGRGKG